jgi:hypothetical protein
VTELEELQLRVGMLTRLLENSRSSPIAEPQLTARLEAAKEELQKFERREGDLFDRTPVALTKVALFLRGRSVTGDQGISTSLAGQALQQYENLYAEQALHEERETSRQNGGERRKRGTPRPELLFIGTPRGSFGLEFSPKPAEDNLLAQAHVNAVQKTTQTIATVCNQSLDADRRIEGVLPSVLGELRKFMRVLAEHEVELRIASSKSKPVWISKDAILNASNFLTNSVEERTILVPCVFRGITHETRHFDIVDNDGVVFTGYVNDAHSDEDLERFDSYLHRKCEAELLETTIATVTGRKIRTTYTLMEIQPSTSPEATS